MKTKWLTVTQIAEKLGYSSPSTVRARIRKLTKAGLLPADIDDDGDSTYRIKESDFNKALEQGLFEVKGQKWERGKKREKTTTE